MMKANEQIPIMTRSGASPRRRGLDPCLDLLLLDYEQVVATHQTQ